MAQGYQARIYAGTLTKGKGKPRSPGHLPGPKGPKTCMFSVKVDGGLPKRMCSAPSRDTPGATHCFEHKWQEAMRADIHPAAVVDESHQQLVGSIIKPAKIRARKRSHEKQLAEYFADRQFQTTKTHKVARIPFYSGPDMQKAMGQ